MLIEFLGIPGSGKTTLSRALCAELGKSGYDVWNLDRYFLDVGFKMPKITFNAYKRKYTQLIGWTYKSRKKLSKIPWLEILVNSDGFRYFTIRSVITNTVLQEIVMKSPDNRINVFDEGLLQRAYSIFVKKEYKAVKHNRLRDYLRHNNHADIVVYMNTPLETAYNRMMVRGVPDRMKGMSDENMLDMLKQGQMFIRQVIDNIDSDKVVEIDVQDRSVAHDGGIHVIRRRIHTHAEQYV